MKKILPASLTILISFLFIIFFMDLTHPKSSRAQQSDFFPHLYDHPVPQGILDGTPTNFVVTGYSTSLWPDDNNNWPAVLQKMLNMHAGNSTTYKVFNEAKGSTPIAKWTKICATDSVSLNVINKYKSSSTRKIMLGQQSTQWAFGDCSSEGRKMEIEVGLGETPSSADQSRIQLGADAINYFANLWLNNGFDRVYIGTHIYTDSMGCCFNKTNNFPYHLYGERFAMAKALDQGSNKLYPGPENWGISRSLYPEPFASEADICGYHTDGRHPLGRTAAAMALNWYTVLAGDDAKTNVMQYAANIAGVPIPNRNQSIPAKGFYCDNNPNPTSGPTAVPSTRATATPTKAPTKSPSSTATPIKKPGDANGDGEVDGVDFVIWLNHYNTTTSNGPLDGDFDNSGKVDGVDFSIWLNNYKK